MERAAAIAGRVLDHLLCRVSATAANTEPFGHLFFTDVLPEDVYGQMLEALPPPELYAPAAERHYRGEAGGTFVRSLFALDHAGLDRLPARHRELWRGLAAALATPALKRAVYTQLGGDLSYRFGVPMSQVAELPGFTRPTLYRETDGFEIPPHPDTRRKVVTMQFYLPADLSQLSLGTALYRRNLVAWPGGDWRRRFTEVKRFAFRPNSGYAFVVNNTLRKKSWHGRARLPEGAGVRNTLLATFYEVPREGFSDYLPVTRVDEPHRRAA
jgi:hypothetical protein